MQKITENIINPGIKDLYLIVFAGKPSWAVCDVLSQLYKLKIGTWQSNSYYLNQDLLKNGASIQF